MNKKIKRALRRVLPPYTGSSADTVFGISVYGSPHHEAWWFRHTIRRAHKGLQKIDAVYYWFHYRVRRYDIVRTDLGFCYADADERMFRACFALLGEFVEQELGREAWFEGSELYRGYRLHFEGDEQKRLIDLWLWYRDELPRLIDDYDDDMRMSFSGKMQTRDIGNGLTEVISFGQTKEPRYPHDWPSTVKDEKLRELIALRRHMWT